MRALVSAPTTPFATLAEVPEPQPRARPGAGRGQGVQPQPRRDAAACDECRRARSPAGIWPAWSLAPAADGSGPPGRRPRGRAGRRGGVGRARRGRPPSSSPSCPTGSPFEQASTLPVAGLTALRSARGRRLRARQAGAGHRRQRRGRAVRHPAGQARRRSRDRDRAACSRPARARAPTRCSRSSSQSGENFERDPRCGRRPGARQVAMQRGGPAGDGRQLRVDRSPSRSATRRGSCSPGRPVPGCTGSTSSPS